MEELDQEVDRLSAEVGDLDLKNQTLKQKLEEYYSPEDYQRLAEKIHELEETRSQSTNPTVELSDLTKIRDRTLAELKLGRQAPGYKAAQKALDSFIKQLEGKQ